jgi:glycosyltransferase involved in cell wall biosynthesis
MIEGIPVRSAGNLRSYPLLPNGALIELVRKEKPDVVLWSVSPLDYLYLNTYRNLGVPVVGIFTGPLYRLSDITRLGIRELVKNRSALSMHLIYALLPDRFTSGVVNDAAFASVFAMSKKNCHMLEQAGADKSKIMHVPAGVDELDFAKPPADSSVAEKFGLKQVSFNVLYLGSPATVRGIDTLIRAISRLKEKIPDIRLLILSRRRSGELYREEQVIREMIEELHVDDNVRIVSGFLDRDDVKKFVDYSDVVALPFKVVPSDVPTSILESMAMRKAVISTNLDGIPELLEGGRGMIIEPCDDVSLSEKILACYTDRAALQAMSRRSGEYMDAYYRWSDVSRMVKSNIEELVSGNGKGEA